MSPSLHIITCRLPLSSDIAMTYGEIFIEIKKRYYDTKRPGLQAYFNPELNIFDFLRNRSGRLHL